MAIKTVVSRIKLKAEFYINSEVNSNAARAFLAAIEKARADLLPECGHHLEIKEIKVGVMNNGK